MEHSRREESLRSADLSSRFRRRECQRFERRHTERRSVSWAKAVSRSHRLNVCYRFGRWVPASEQEGLREVYSLRQAKPDHGCEPRFARTLLAACRQRESFQKQLFLVALRRYNHPCRRSRADTHRLARAMTVQPLPVYAIAQDPPTASARPHPTRVSPCLLLEKS